MKARNWPGVYLHNVRHVERSLRSACPWHSVTVTKPRHRAEYLVQYNANEYMQTQSYKQGSGKQQYLKTAEKKWAALKTYPQCAAYHADALPTEPLRKLSWTGQILVYTNLSLYKGKGIFLVIHVHVHQNVQVDNLSYLKTWQQSSITMALHWVFCILCAMRSDAKHAWMLTGPTAESMGIRYVTWLLLNPWPE